MAKGVSSVATISLVKQPYAHFSTTYHNQALMRPRSPMTVFSFSSYPGSVFFLLVPPSHAHAHARVQASVLFLERKTPLFFYTLSPLFLISRKSEGEMRRPSLSFNEMRGTREDKRAYHRGSPCIRLFLRTSLDQLHLISCSRLERCGTRAKCWMEKRRRGRASLFLDSVSKSNVHFLAPSLPYPCPRLSPSWR